MKALLRVLMSLLFLWVMPVSMSAQEVRERMYTETSPLVYEDAWDLWPYTFLDENGVPVGYNIDLLKLIFKELDIPYVIKLRPTQLALENLRDGHSDLMCGMDAHFHNEYARYGSSVIQIFTHSVVHRKNEPVKIKIVEDLADNEVLVHGGSFSHHLMERLGWGGNAVPYDDMQDAVQRVHNEPGHQIVWNTLSLEYLIRKFHYDDLELTPVNIQHGEYKFMSNNPRLLQQLDSVYTVLNASGRLQPIQNKWFYPERKETGIPSWIWVVVGVLLLLTLIFLMAYLVYRKREHRMTKSIRSSNQRLSLILKTCHVRIWVYHVETKTIMTYDDNGHVENENLSPSFFFYSLAPDDLLHIQQALGELSLQQKEKEVLDVRMKDGEGGEYRHLTIDLSVLRRDRNGHPTDLIGTTSDVTDERLRQQQVEDNMLRYRTVFNTAMFDIMTYDEHGVIIDMNDKALRAFPFDKQDILDAQLTLNDVLGMKEVNARNIEYTYLTQLLGSADDQRAMVRFQHAGEMFYELQLQPVRDARGHLLGVYGTGLNVTERVRAYRALQANIRQLQQANGALGEYIRNIDFVLKNGGVRMVSYSLEQHTLTLFGETEGRELTLSQTRALTLLDDDSKRVALKAFNSMDNRTRQTVEASIRTLLRHRGGMAYESCPLSLFLSLIPTLDDSGQVTGYFGMCRDQSEIKATELQLEQETAKAQEVETVKNAFLRNMSYQIRTPLNSVVGFAELFELEHDAADEPYFIQEISQNASRLLELINDILFLSRLDAQMIEIKREPLNFEEFFLSRCETAWFNDRQPGVQCVAESAYQRLVVDIDMQHVGIIIDQIVANAAKYTASGQIHASYDYTGEDLVITVQDTGRGIPAEQQKHLFERFAMTGSRGTGLGLSISMELARLMGGKVRVHSEEGRGTIVWVTIPCTCSEIVRK